MSDVNAAERVRLEQVSDRKQEEFSSIVKKDFELVKDVRLNLDIRVGTVDISMGNLFSLTNGSLLELDQDVGTPVEILLEGRLVALGNLVSVDGMYGVEISKLSDK